MHEALLYRVATRARVVQLFGNAVAQRSDCVTFAGSHGSRGSILLICGVGVYLVQCVWGICWRRLGDIHAFAILFFCHANVRCQFGFISEMHRWGYGTRWQFSNTIHGMQPHASHRGPQRYAGMCSGRVAGTSMSFVYSVSSSGCGGTEGDPWAEMRLYYLFACVGSCGWPVCCFRQRQCVDGCGLRLLACRVWFSVRNSGSNRQRCLGTCRGQMCHICWRCVMSRLPPARSTCG